MVIIGVDVGLDGGITFLNDLGKIVFCTVMPTVHNKGKTKRDYDLVTIKKYIRTYVDKDAHAYIEIVHSFKAQGVSSTFTLGKGFGMILGLLEGNDVNYTLISPQKWRKIIVGTFKDSTYKENKKISIKKAQELFPKQSFLATQRSKVPHDGMCESALIAFVGYLETKEIENG